MTKQEETPMRLRISNFFFRLLFRGQWEHMRHLIDDVICLELEKQGKFKTKITTGSNSRTVVFNGN